MSVANTVRNVQFIGDGVATSLPFSFKVFSAADMLAQQTVGTVGSVGAVVTTLLLNTDYTVTLNPDQNVSAGGSIILTVAAAVGVTIDVTSRTPKTQNVNLNNAGGFFPQVVNDALDRATIHAQEIEAQAVKDKVHVDYTAANAKASELAAASSEANAASSANEATTMATNTSNAITANMQGYVASAASSEANAASSANEATTMATIATNKASNLPPNYIGKTTDLGLVTDNIITSISNLGTV